MRVTVLIVPGLRDAVPAHWQSWLATALAQRQQPVYSVVPMGRDQLRCADRVAAIEQAVRAIDGPLVAVAHSAGCLSLVHWAQTSARTHQVKGALLATPPDFETPLPDGYPTPEALQQGAWLPVPRQRLPFNSLVALSQNDPLGEVKVVAQLAADWGAESVDVGAVGHLNPAAGYGPWPQALALLDGTGWLR